MGLGGWRKLCESCRAFHSIATVPQSRAGESGERCVTGYPASPNRNLPCFSREDVSSETEQPAEHETSTEETNKASPPLIGADPAKMTVRSRPSPAPQIRESPLLAASQQFELQPR